MVDSSIKVFLHYIEENGLDEDSVRDQVYERLIKIQQYVLGNKSHVASAFLNSENRSPSLHFPDETPRPTAVIALDMSKFGFKAESAIIAVSKRRSRTERIALKRQDRFGNGINVHALSDFVQSYLIREPPIETGEELSSRFMSLMSCDAPTRVLDKDEAWQLLSTQQRHAVRCSVVGIPKSACWINLQPVRKYTTLLSLLQSHLGRPVKRIRYTLQGVLGTLSELRAEDDWCSFCFNVQDIFVDLIATMTDVS